MPKISLKLVHFVAVLHYATALWYDFVYVNKPGVTDYLVLRRLKFLTFWNLLLQATFFTVCFINDLKGTNRPSPKAPVPLVRKLKDVLLPCLAFPISMFVGLTFWALYAVDRELVFPKAIDAYFPTWLNHCMHTNIMIFIVLEMATSKVTYPSRKFGLTVVSGFMFVYLVWIHIIYSYTETWVYPVLAVLNLPMRVVFFVALLGLSVALYILGEKLNSAFWPERHAKRKR